MTLSSSWRSPSNIALIKYWGKHGVQLPQNPSLSFTLEACHTAMKLSVIPEKGDQDLTFLYQGSPRPSFVPKIKVFLELMEEHMPWLRHASVEIDSSNTFPHGAGIASSASAMSALALCLTDIDDQINARQSTIDGAWWLRVSQYARLGSGSACRSVHPVMALWGQLTRVTKSSDEYAVPWKEEIAPFFHDYRDTILVVSAAEKSVSSTAGHALMRDLPYASTRYDEARANTWKLINALRSSDQLDEFIRICESEALQLHALMMMGRSPFMLIAPGTVSIIHEVWRYRKETNIPVCFTLDAGPNVHLLYPAQYADDVRRWVDEVLIRYCANGFFIEDRVGNGPERIL